MSSISEICDTIGRKRLAQALGVGRTQVSNAAVADVFPARWYAVVKALCDAEGIECPLTLFSFIAAPEGEAPVAGSSAAVLRGRRLARKFDLFSVHNHAPRPCARQGNEVSHA